MPHDGRLKITHKRRDEKRAKREIDKFIEEARPDSPRTVRFPDGSRRIAFNAYVHCNGSLRATRRYLEKTKSLAGGRVPSLKTLTIWSRDDMWESLRHMVDDGLIDLLEAQEDPDIKEAIRDDTAFFKVLIGLRSAILVSMMAKNSPLMPRNASDAVKVLGMISNQTESIRARGKDSQKRRGISEDADGEIDVPDNVGSIAAALKKRGIVPTEEAIAREVLARREEELA